MLKRLQSLIKNIVPFKQLVFIKFKHNTTFKNWRTCLIRYETPVQLLINCPSPIDFLFSPCFSLLCHFIYAPHPPTPTLFYHDFIFMKLREKERRLVILCAILIRFSAKIRLSYILAKSLEELFALDWSFFSYHFAIHLSKCSILRVMKNSISNAEERKRGHACICNFLKRLQRRREKKRKHSAATIQTQILLESHPCSRLQNAHKMTTTMTFQEKKSKTHFNKIQSPTLPSYYSDIHLSNIQMAILLCMKTVSTYRRLQIHT